MIAGINGKQLETDLFLSPGLKIIVGLYKNSIALSISPKTGS
jgi:hypothetical protein